MVADEFMNKLKQFQMKADSDLDARVHDRIEKMDLGSRARPLWACVRWGEQSIALLSHRRKKTGDAVVLRVCLPRLVWSRALKGPPTVEGRNTP